MAFGFGEGKGMCTEAWLAIVIWAKLPQVYRIARVGMIARVGVVMGLIGQSGLFLTRHSA
jgi:hypothetical protein